MCYNAEPINKFKTFDKLSMYIQALWPPDERRRGGCAGLSEARRSEAARVEDGPAPDPGRPKSTPEERGGRRGPNETRGTAGL